MNTSGAAAVGLPEGLVAVVKRDCPTCELVAPVLAELNERAGLTVITQDDPHFPADAAWVVHDSDLAMSWHNDISTVPTLLRVDGGQADERTEGWSRQDWEELSGVAGLGATLPDWRPGCGSLSVDPLLAPELEIRFSGSPLRSRRVRLGAGEDIFEAMVDRGWSDGLPLVPPTEARVMRMLQGTSRHPQEVVTVAPPDRVDCTVEKVAVNAVMAGCAPEHLSVVLAAVEAVCTDEFNIHGVLATTMSVAPVLVVNGPVAARIGMNSGVNVLGQGNRANSTIGRAVQLVVRNVGGGRPGGVDRATFGSPAKVGFCFTEAEAPDGWPTLAESRGWRPDQSVVTAFCGEAPRILTDQKSRTPESLTRHLAQALMTCVSPRVVQAMDAMLVLSPEHMGRFTDAGWSRERFMAELEAELLVRTDNIVAGAGGIDEGLPAAAAGMELGKFRPGGLLLTHAGGRAGLFSSIIAGWASGPKGSDPVSREILH